MYPERREFEPDEKHMSFLDHLDELRTCIINVVIGLVVCTVIGYAFTNQALSMMTEPLRRKTLPPGFLSAKVEKKIEPLKLKINEKGDITTLNWSEWLAQASERTGKPEVQLVIPPTHESATTTVLSLTAGPGETEPGYLIYLNPITPFMLKLKAAFLLGLLISLPWTLWQLWIFMKPGLHVKERKYVSRIVASALLLFPLGAAFAWFTVPYALGFLETFAFAGLAAQLEVGKYLNMVLTMMIAMGAVFELPLVVLFLVKLGIISTAQLRKYRRQAIVVIFLVSAFFTPPDVFTMTIMAFPLILLYEISLIVSDMLVPPSKQSSHFDGKFDWTDEEKEEES